MCFDGCYSICQRLERDDPSLTVLNLNHQYMGNDGAKALAGALRHNTRLVVLFLQHNHLGPTGARALVDALRGHPRLAHAYLDYNRLGDASCAALAHMISSCPALRVLKVTDNRIGPNGVRVLAQEALCKDDAPLEYLSLQNNALGATGMRTLCEALVTNRSLRWIDVRCNKVTTPCQQDAVTTAWIRLLRDDVPNRTLRVLELWGTRESWGTAAAALTGELRFWVQWNRVGRRSLLTHHHDPVPVARLLANAANPTLASPAVLMATLSARPDLLMSSSSSSSSSC